MVRGLYTSALGMITQMQRMDVVANNIANADTTGYKRDQVVSQSFSEEIAKRLNDPSRLNNFSDNLRLFNDFPIGKLSQGVFVDDVYTDFSSGGLRQTSGTLDVAIDGEGFFCVMVDGTELYSRDGAFTLGPDNGLYTKDGGRVQGLGGDITLPQGYIAIDEMGRIFVENEYIDTIKMTDFTDKHLLRKEKDNYYRPFDGAEQTAFEGKLIQGFLEGSNVRSVKEMVEMITLSRAYETNSRILTVIDTTMNRAVNDIGRR